MILLEKSAVGRTGVMNFVNTVAPEWWSTTTDPNVITTARENIATLLSQ